MCNVLCYNGTTDTRFGLLLFLCNLKRMAKVRLFGWSLVICMRRNLMYYLLLRIMLCTRMNYSWIFPTFDALVASIKFGDSFKIVPWWWSQCYMMRGLQLQLSQFMTWIVYSNWLMSIHTKSIKISFYLICLIKLIINSDCIWFTRSSTRKNQYVFERWNKVGHCDWPDLDN